MFQSENLIVRNVDLHFYLYIIGFTITAYLMQNLTTRATYLKKASFIMPFNYITIILTAIMDFYLFGNSFDGLSIFGMFLTSIGLLAKIFVPWSEKRKSQGVN